MNTEEKYAIQDELYAKTSKPYRNRIALAKEIIREFLRITKRPHLAISWGKDSLVMLHLVQQIKPDILAVFNHCLELPETLEARDCYLKQFPETNYKEIKSDLSYTDIKEIYNEKHMYQLAKDSAYNKCKFIFCDLNSDGCLVGLRKEESIKRRMLLKKKGLIYWDQSREMYKCCPMGNWKAEDIYAYAWENFIKLSKRYYRDETFCKRGDIRTSWTVGPEMLTAGRVVELKYYDLGLYNKISGEVEGLSNFT